MKKENVLLYAAGVAILYGSYRLLKAVATKVLDVMAIRSEPPPQMREGSVQELLGSMPRARFIQGGASGLGKRA